MMKMSAASSAAPSTPNSAIMASGVSWAKSCGMPKESTIGGAALPNWPKPMPQGKLAAHADRSRGGPLVVDAEMEHVERHQRGGRGDDEAAGEGDERARAPAAA